MTITLWLNGKGMGKARPRVGKRGAFMPEPYMQLKRNMILQIQAHGISAIDYAVKVDCSFVNFKSSDSDNLIGFYLDCLVDSGLLKNDSSSFVSGCSGRFVKTRKIKNEEKPVGCLIKISKADIEYLDIALDLARIYKDCA